MKSPFPGMDPYLEGAKWPDVHHKLMTVFSELITPLISPKYFASVETYTVVDDEIENEMGIIYPDVAILKTKFSEPSVAYQSVNSNDDKPKITPATITIPTSTTIKVKIPKIEIRDVEKNRLITVIEILSPVNKRNPGLTPYRKKRKQLYEKDIHLLEIDLLRGGTRPLNHKLLLQNHYYVALIRAKGATEIWSFNVSDNLPVLPVPLLSPDKDIPLDLGKALQLVYERSFYKNVLNYTQSPPKPDFQPEVQIWIDEQLKTAGII